LNPCRGRALFRGLGPVAELVQAIGYGALLMVLCQIPAVRRLFGGLGSVGQMALTNYLTQSVFFVFVLYGFGFGLLPWMGPALSLAFAVVLFTAQIRVQPLVAGPLSLRPRRVALALGHLWREAGA